MAGYLPSIAVCDPMTKRALSVAAGAILVYSGRGGALEGLPMVGSYLSPPVSYALAGIGVHLYCAAPAASAAAGVAGSYLASRFL